MLSIYNEGFYHLDKFFIIFKFILVRGFLYQLNEVNMSTFIIGWKLHFGNGLSYLYIIFVYICEVGLF